MRVVLVTCFVRLLGIAGPMCVRVVGQGPPLLMRLRCNGYETICQLYSTGPLYCTLDRRYFARSWIARGYTRVPKLYLLSGHGPGYVHVIYQGTFCCYCVSFAARVADLCPCLVVLSFVLCLFLFV